MQLLIFQTALLVERAPAWLSLGTALDLKQHQNGSVVALARRASRWPFLIGTRVRIGTLSETAAGILRPAIHGQTRLRVRIVTLTPAHLAPDRTARIAISVWGDGRALR